MSKGGWARLMKQQEQESTQSKSDAVGYHLVDSISYNNNMISLKQQQLITAQPQHMSANIFNTTAGSPPPGSILQVAVHDQGEFRASRLFQIIRRWKTHSVPKQITPPAPLQSMSAPRSPSCSMLSFVPLSCITFSSIDLYSDHEDDNDDDHGNEIDIASNPLRKNAKIRSPRLHHRSRSAQYTTSQSSQKPTMKKTQSTGKERDMACERKIRSPARRAVSCPKLISSPLSSCTAFPSMQGEYSVQEGEELECLQPKQEEEERMRLKRSSYISSKQASTPKGYLALYVGEERRRFLVKAKLLNHPLFSMLLEKAKEEFGFDQKGPLNIPCDIAFFQHIMLLVESNDPSYKNADHSSILLHFNSPNQLAASVEIAT